MAKADFCFTYYDGDATRDMQHMDRLCRGAYHDLIIMQRKVPGGRLTMDHIRAVLGKDFEACWYSLLVVLKKDGDCFYIEWVENSIERMRKSSEKQSENARKRWEKEKSDFNAMAYNKDTTALKNYTNAMPLENGYGYEQDSLKRGEGEKLLVPQMLTVLKDHLPHYAVSPGRDFQPLYDIAAFLAEQMIGAGPPLQNIGVVMAEWRKICQYLSNPENFYHTKSLKTISTHIQEIFQRHEQPKRNSKKNGLGPKSGGFGILNEVERKIGLL